MFFGFSDFWSDREAVPTATGREVNRVPHEGASERQADLR